MRPTEQLRKILIPKAMEKHKRLPDTTPSISALPHLRQRLEKLYGNRLVDVMLFGSYARGEAVPGSDIDVLVVLQGPVHPGEEIARVGNFTSTLSLQYDTVISCTFISEERFKTEHSPLLLNIRREGVSL